MYENRFGGKNWECRYYTCMLVGSREEVDKKALYKLNRDSLYWNAICDGASKI